jgi:hypothetical protein
MKLASFFQSSPPPHAFGLSAQAVAYAQLARRGDALQRVERCRLLEGWYELGPVGLLHLDRTPLSEALAELRKRWDRPVRRASAVVPNAWVRSLVIEPGQLPRNRGEAEDIVRWRLKKLLPCRPEEVRLDFVPSDGTGRVLVVLGLDKPFAVLEEVFAAAGVSLGRIEPAALALTRVLPAAAEPVMLVALEPRALALALLVEGRVVLVRNKPLPAESRPADVLVARELNRTLAHARADKGLGDSLRVVLACEVPELAEAVEGWALSEAGVTLESMSTQPGGGRGAVPGPGVAELWALLAVSSGGIA